MRRLVLLLVLGLIGQFAQAQSSIAVVVGDKTPVQTLSLAEVAAIFMGQFSESRLKPIDCEENDLRDLFYQRISGKSRIQMRAYWSKMVFSGQARPPRQVDSDRLAAEVVATPMAISYVLANQILPGTKVVLLVQ